MALKKPPKKPKKPTPKRPPKKPTKPDPTRPPKKPKKPKKPLRPVKLPSVIRKLKLLRRVRDWVDVHPAVANAIVWEDSSGMSLPYPSWPQWQKDKLRDTVVSMWLGLSSGLPATPPVTTHLYNSGDLFSTELTPPLAWEYFVAYVAHSIVVEQWKLPWSVNSYTTNELFLLFNSQSLFRYVAARTTYAIMRDHNLLFRHGAVTPGDPFRTFQFLNRNGFIGSTPRVTIERLLDWCRDNLVHFYGGNDPGNLYNHWQYSGWPPVESVIAGTTHPQNGFAHWTGGCWGTSGFLRAVLRTVNIPAHLERRCDHALPSFVREGVYLSHGDDPYNQLSKSQPRFPIGDLLIDQTTFDAWFGAALSETTVCDNVGRRPRELRGLP